MLKLSLVVMCLLSLATLSFASSLIPATDAPIAVAAAQPHAWIETYE